MKRQRYVRINVRGKSQQHAGFKRVYTCVTQKKRTHAYAWYGHACTAQCTCYVVCMCVKKHVQESGNNNNNDNKSRKIIRFKNMYGTKLKAHMDMHGMDAHANCCIHAYTHLHARMYLLCWPTCVPVRCHHFSSSRCARSSSSTVQWGCFLQASFSPRACSSPSSIVQFRHSLQSFPPPIAHFSSSSTVRVQDIAGLCQKRLQLGVSFLPHML